MWFSIKWFEIKAHKGTIKSAWGMCIKLICELHHRILREYLMLFWVFISHNKEKTCWFCSIRCISKPYVSSFFGGLLGAISLEQRQYIFFSEDSVEQKYSTVTSAFHPCLCVQVYHWFILTRLETWLTVAQVENTAFILQSDHFFCCWLKWLVL